MIDLTLERHRDLLTRGTVLVDDLDPGTAPRVLFYLEYAIQDESRTRGGDRRVVSKRLLYVELDRASLWRDDHVAISQLVEDYARYPYLPRLKDLQVLLGSIRDGLNLITWAQDTFAYAESFDEEGGRYRGLRVGEGSNSATQVRRESSSSPQWHGSSSTRKCRSPTETTSRRPISTAPAETIRALGSRRLRHRG